jgi:ligand-binding SRPBCC domain-containing protein
MPRYLIKRTFSVTQGEMPRVGGRSRRLIVEEFPEVTWEHSHVVVDDAGGVVTYCVYEAPDEDTIRAHSMALGEHVLESVFVIASDVTPEDFPLEVQA